MKRTITVTRADGKKRTITVTKPKENPSIPKRIKHTAMNSRDEYIKRLRG